MLENSGDLKCNLVLGSLRDLVNDNCARIVKDPGFSCVGSDNLVAVKKDKCSATAVALRNLAHGVSGFQNTISCSSANFLSFDSATECQETALGLNGAVQYQENDVTHRKDFNTCAEPTSPTSTPTTTATSIDFDAGFECRQENSLTIIDAPPNNGVTCDDHARHLNRLTGLCAGKGTVERFFCADTRLRINTCNADVLRLNKVLRDVLPRPVEGHRPLSCKADGNHSFFVFDAKNSKTSASCQDSAQRLSKVLERFKQGSYTNCGEGYTTATTTASSTASRTATRTLSSTATSTLGSTPSSTATTKRGCNGQTDPDDCIGISAAQCTAVETGPIDISKLCPGLCGSCPEPTRAACNNIEDPEDCSVLLAGKCDSQFLGVDVNRRCPATCGACAQYPPTSTTTQTTLTTANATPAAPIATVAMSRWQCVQVEAADVLTVSNTECEAVAAALDSMVRLCATDQPKISCRKMQQQSFLVVADTPSCETVAMRLSGGLARLGINLVMQCVGSGNLHGTQLCKATTSLLDGAITKVSTETIGTSLDVCDSVDNAFKLLQFHFLRDQDYTDVVDDPTYNEAHLKLKLADHLQKLAGAAPSQVEVLDFIQRSGLVSLRISSTPNAAARRQRRALSAAEVVRKLEVLVVSPDFLFDYKSQVLRTVAPAETNTVAIGAVNAVPSTDNTTVVVLVLILLLVLFAIIMFVFWKKQGKSQTHMIVQHRSVLDQAELARSPDVQYVRRVYVDDNDSRVNSVEPGQSGTTGLYDDTSADFAEESLNDTKGTFKREEQMADNLHDLSMRQKVPNDDPRNQPDALSPTNMSTSSVPGHVVFTLKEGNTYNFTDPTHVRVSYKVDQVDLTAGTPFTHPTAIATTFLEYFWNTQRSSGRLNDEFDGIEEAAGRWKASRPALRASRPQNASKNRDAVHGAFDTTRVVMSGNAGQDYINASHIDGYHPNDKFIAAQAPTKDTVNDFWRMIWENNVTTVASVGTDGGRYWPDEGESVKCGDINVLCSYQTNVCGLDNVVRRDLALENLSTGEERVVAHIQISSWPRMQCPGSISDFAGFITAYREVHQKSGSVGPILVEGMLGVGRAGATILFDICLHSLLDTGLLNMPDALLKLRSQRGKLCQTPEQYAFVLEALVDLLVTRQTADQNSLSPQDQQILQALTDYRMQLADAENQNRLANDGGDGSGSGETGEYDNSNALQATDYEYDSLYDVNAGPALGSPPAKTLPPGPPVHYVKAIQNYIPATDAASKDDLPFASGQVLKVHEEPDEDGFYEASHMTGPLKGKGVLCCWFAIAR